MSLSPHENIHHRLDEIEFILSEISNKVTGMQGRLIHDYLGVDYTIVWDVAKSKLPDLRTKLQVLLKKIE